MSEMVRSKPGGRVLVMLRYGGDNTVRTRDITLLHASYNTHLPVVSSLRLVKGIG